MKKIKPLVYFLIALLVCCSAAGCGAKESEQQITIYSYCGEDDQFSLSNGIIAVTETETIIYGGVLEEKEEKFDDITASSMGLYVLVDGEEITLTDFQEVDMTGDGHPLSNPGSATTSGSLPEKDDLEDNLYFEVSITRSNGERLENQIKLSVTNVTALFEQ